MRDSDPLERLPYWWPLLVFPGLPFLGVVFVLIVQGLRELLYLIKP